MERTTYLIKLKDPGSSHAGEYIAAALLATDIAIAVQLLQLPSLSASLNLALWCIAISAPGLAFDFILNLYTNERGYFLEIFPALNYNSFYIVVAFIALLAVAAVIHHFLPWAAYTFGALSVLAFVRLRRYVTLLEAQIEKESKQ